MRQKFLVVLAALAGLCLAAAPSRAAVYSTSGGSVSAVGDTIGSDFDKIVLDPFTGTITAPGIYALNTLHFIVGVNALVPACCYSGTISETLTIGAQTKTLAVPYTVDISYSDTLTIAGGATLLFDNYRVTLNALGPMTRGAGTFDETLYATVTAVPEPSTWAMLLIGFAALGFTGWRARRQVAAV